LLNERTDRGFEFWLGGSRGLVARCDRVLDDRYLLTELIGNGGFSEVWSGRDQVLGRPVAVKLLYAGFASHAETLRRFELEARHAGLVAHDNVARVYDYGAPAADHTPYLVMELVDGESLAHALEREGPLAAGRTLEIIIQSATGLQAAHEAGLIHRDIKPANLLLSGSGLVKITDFGISQVAGSEPLTRTGMIVGSPGYLAPERAGGAHATVASDLYALGVVAYECLTGERPFTRDLVSYGNWRGALRSLNVSLDGAAAPLPERGPAEIRSVAKALNLTGDLAKQAEKLTAQLYNAFVAKDMAMLEINPLVVTKQGQLRVLDAKVSFDDNALFRHPEVAALRDETEEDAKEIEASKYDLNYVTLDGTIGCMVNGAGLAMATMDIIKLYGMAPANFLDVGGSASKEKVAAAFKIITADPNVKGILVNIFGGIMKCDVIAEGVVAAVKEVGLKVPLVVRLEGTNVDAGKKIIRESGLNVLSADDLDDAAQKIVKAVKGN